MPVYALELESVTDVNASFIIRPLSLKAEYLASNLIDY